MFWLRISGSVSREALAGKLQKSVFYPFKRFQNLKIRLQKFLFFIDAENEEDAEILKNLTLKFQM